MKNSLARHKLTHKGEKPYHCDKSFSQNNQLTKDKSIVAGEKIYNTSFYQNGNLTIHKRHWQQRILQWSESTFAIFQRLKENITGNRYHTEYVNTWWNYCGIFLPSKTVSEISLLLHCLECFEDDMVF
ncbi:---NA--- [Octopus vulgaris]|uniref:---NA n=1 Tax=Octopus vulgaris TaxID=6645 RepID=A0AA36C1T8_OCTVU|nr:---NA--- [Octopus vulgaris]